jgi:hypothetical protein
VPAFLNHPERFFAKKQIPVMAEILIFTFRQEYCMAFHIPGEQQEADRMLFWNRKRPLPRIHWYRYQDQYDNASWSHNLLTCLKPWITNKRAVNHRI